METVTQDRFDNPTVEIALYTQGHLNHDVGRTAEANALMLLETVFDLATLNYQIHYDFPIRHYVHRTGVCEEPFDSFNSDVLNGDVPLVAKDVNVLLLDGRAGGCSNAPDNNPNACTVGATPLANFTEYSFTTAEVDGLAGSSAHALLHEMGHNLGFSHTPHGGYGFNADGKWWRTPTVGGNDMENVCGEFVEARQHDPSEKFLFYHWCAVANFDIVDEPKPTPPPVYPPNVDGVQPIHADKLPESPNEPGPDLRLAGIAFLGGLVFVYVKDQDD